MTEDQKLRVELRCDIADLLALAADLNANGVDLGSLTIPSAATLKRAARALADRLEDALRPITMQDVRLAAGEGKLSLADVLAGCNAELQRRSRAPAAPSDGGE